MKKVSFVIPCYRSEKTIKYVVDEIITIVQNKSDYTYEIILVNDCSPDDVFKVIQELCFSDNKIKGINFTKNFGQQSALMAGQAAATGDIIVCLDDDGQSPVDKVFLFIDKLNEGYDVVFAKYRLKKQSVIKNIGSWLNNKMVHYFFEIPKKLRFSSFFVMKRFVSDEMIKYCNPYPYNIGLILSITKSIVNIECADRKRIEGRTGYTIVKLIGLWVNGFTNFSVKPLRIAMVFGVLCGTFGFVFGVYTVVRKLLHPEILAGYSGIIAMISIVGGMILLVLGVIGEYVGRIFISINKSPQYIVKDFINKKIK